MGHEAKLDLIADDTQAKAKIDQHTKQIANLEEQNRKMYESAKKGAKEALESHERWAEGMKRLAEQQGKFNMNMQALSRSGSGLPDFRGQIETFKLSFAGFNQEQSLATLGTQALAAGVARLGTVIGVGYAGVSQMKKAYGEWGEKLDHLVERHHELGAQIAKSKFLSPDLGDDAEVERIVRGVKGIKSEDVREVLEGVSNEAPLETLKRRGEVSQSLARISPTGVNKGAMGSLAAQFMTMLPNAKSEDVADLATLFAQQAGGHLERFQGEKFQRSMRNLMAAGAPKDEALAMGLSAAQGHISPALLEQLAGLASAPSESLSHLGQSGRDPKVQAERKLSHLSGWDRVRAVMKDQNLAQGAFGHDALPLSRMQETLAHNVELTRGVTSSDVIEGAMSKWRNTSQSGPVEMKYMTEYEHKKRLSAVKERESLWSQIDENASLQFDDNPWGGRAFKIASYASKTARHTRDMLGLDSKEEMEGSNAILKAIADLLREQLRLKQQQLNRPPPLAIETNTEKGNF